jgi:hypothetical protein
MARIEARPNRRFGLLAVRHALEVPELYPEQVQLSARVGESVNYWHCSSKLRHALGRITGLEIQVN